MNISIRTDGISYEHFDNLNLYENTFKIRIKKNNYQNIKEFRLIKASNVDYEIPVLFNHLKSYFNLISRKYIPVNLENIPFYIEESVNNNILERNGLRQGFIFSFDIFKKNKDLEILSKYRNKTISKNEYDEYFLEAFQRNTFTTNKGNNSNEINFAFLNFKKYLNGDISYQEIFDKNSLYSYLLISLLWHDGYAHHLQKHNIEFYFNPLSQKIHLIGKDPFVLYNNVDENKLNFYQNSSNWLNNIFLDENFINEFYVFAELHLSDHKLLNFIEEFNHDIRGYNDPAVPNKTNLLRNIDRLIVKFNNHKNLKDKRNKIINELFDINNSKSIKFADLNLSKKTFLIDNSNKSIYLKNKTTVIDDELIISQKYKDYIFEIYPGQKIIFKKNGSLKIFSKINFVGKENDLIILKSQSKNSFLFIENTMTHLKNILIDDFNISKLDVKSNFYTSPITLISEELNLENVEISNAVGEDAMNIVNSRFDIKNLKINNTSSDALDIDNSNGKIKELKIMNCKNDCLDLSSSKISIFDLVANTSDDKNISIGENSEVLINNAVVDNCKKICIAIKDQSNVILENIEISNGDIGIAMFIKKDIFHSPFLKSKKLIFNDVKYNLATDSKINKKNFDLKYKPYKINVDELYR